MKPCLRLFEGPKRYLVLCNIKQDEILMFDVVPIVHPSEEILVDFEPKKIKLTCRKGKDVILREFALHGNTLAVNIGHKV